MRLGRICAGALCGLATTLAVSGLATAPVADAGGRAIAHAIDLGRLHGYHVELDARRGPVTGHVATPVARAEDADNRPEIRLRVARGGARSIYSTKGIVTPGEIRLRSPLIRLRLRFEPERDLAVVPWCDHSFVRTTSGTYVGSFRFRGERGYLRLARHRLLGERTLTPGTCGPTRAASPGRAGSARRGALAAILAVHDAAAATHLYALARQDGHGALYASNRGRRGPIVVRRFALARARGEGLSVTPGLDTATVGPLAPLFRGAATFTAPGSWAGDLAVRFIGVGPTPLTGPAFTATLEPGA